jgi:hypothetical protein
MGLWLKKDGEFVPVSGGGGDAGPHDHDYLPLEGGVLTGDLQVDGQVRTPTTADTGAPAYTFAGATGAGMWCYSNDLMGFAVSGVEFFRNEGGVSRFKGDLQVDGNAAFKISSSNTPGYGMGQLKAGNGASLRLYSEGDANYANRILVNASLLDLDESTSLLVRGNATVKGNLKVEGIFTPEGGTAFGITEGIDTADVLDRAEVAAMPAPEEAVVDGLTVNEVVTALLLKVKALSAEIEELKGA